MLSNRRPTSCCLCAQLADKEEEISLLASECVGKDERLDALERYPNATQPTVSRPFRARFAPFFRRSFVLSGFLAPRRRERAKNGGKWAKFGGETGEKQRWLSGVGDRAAMAPKNWGKLCASLRQRYGSGPSGIAMGEVELRFFVEIWEHVTGERFEDAVAISRAEVARMLGQVRTSPPV